MSDTAYHIAVVAFCGVGIVLLAFILAKVHRQGHYIHELNKRMKLFEEAKEKEIKD